MHSSEKKFNPSNIEDIEVYFFEFFIIFLIFCSKRRPAVSLNIENNTETEHALRLKKLAGFNSATMPNRLTVEIRKNVPHQKT